MTTSPRRIEMAGQAVGRSPRNRPAPALSCFTGSAATEREPRGSMGSELVADSGRTPCGRPG